MLEQRPERLRQVLYVPEHYHQPRIALVPPRRRDRTGATEPPLACNLSLRRLKQRAAVPRSEGAQLNLNLHCQRGSQVLAETAH